MVVDHHGHALRKAFVHTECIRLVCKLSEYSTTVWRFEQGERPSALGQKGVISMSASLIGRWGQRFQTIHLCSVDVAHGLALLFGIGTKALPYGIRGRGGTIYQAALSL